MLKGLALDLARLATQSGANALIGSLLGGLLGGGGPGPLPNPAGFAESIGFGRGAAFAPAGSVMARNIKTFARGGIVDTPEAFAFAGGLGIMGEAGPAFNIDARGAPALPPPAPANAEARILAMAA